MGKFFDSKGQVSFEFILTVLMVLMVLGFGLYIFEDRSVFNSTSIRAWEAGEVAHRIARNLNSAYYLDGNVAFSDYINWVGEGKSVEFSENVVWVWWDSINFANAYIAAPYVDSSVSDFNGEMVFGKTNGKVLVRYP